MVVAGAARPAKRHAGGRNKWCRPGCRLEAANSVRGIIAWEILNPGWSVATQGSI